MICFIVMDQVSPNNHDIQEQLLALMARSSNDTSTLLPPSSFYRASGILDLVANMGDPEALMIHVAPPTDEFEGKVESLARSYFVRLQPAIVKTSSYIRKALYCYST